MTDTAAPEWLLQYGPLKLPLTCSVKQYPKRTITIHDVESMTGEYWRWTNDGTRVVSEVYCSRKLKNEKGDRVEEVYPNLQGIEATFGLYSGFWSEFVVPSVHNGVQYELPLGAFRHISHGPGFQRHQDWSPTYHNRLVLKSFKNRRDGLPKNELGFVDEVIN